MVDIQPALIGLRYLRDFTKWVTELQHDAEVLGRVNDALAKVGDVQDKLQELREDNLRLLEERRQLAERLNALERQATTAKQLVYRAPVYYLRGENDKEDGPYCQRCWDVDKCLVRVHLYGDSTTAYCHQCVIENRRGRE